MKTLRQQLRESLDQTQDPLAGNRDPTSTDLHPSGEAKSEGHKAKFLRRKAKSKQQPISFLGQAWLYG